MKTIIIHFEHNCYSNLDMHKSLTFLNFVLAVPSDLLSSICVAFHKVPVCKRAFDVGLSLI